MITSVKYERTHTSSWYNISTIIGSNCQKIANTAVTSGFLTKTPFLSKMAQVQQKLDKKYQKQAQEFLNGLAPIWRQQKLATC